MFEESSALDDLFGRIVQQAVDNLDRSTRQRKSRPRASVEACIGSKPNGGLSAVDYSLGIVNLGLQKVHGDGRESLRDGQLQWVDRLDRHLAHVASFDEAVHRQRFDIVDQPHWARHITGMKSSSEVSSTFSTLITSGSVGPFEFLNSVDRLAKSVGVTPQVFQQGMEAAADPGSYKFPVALIKGKRRTFTVPTHSVLIMLQRRLHEFLRPLTAYLHPSCVGYVPGRGAIDAARPHSGKTWVQRLDIENFYPSTSRVLVKEALMRLGAVEAAADAIACVATFDDKLPTGVRTSPVLSNVVLGDFDSDVAAAAEERGLAYTRYADDMIFSSEKEFDATEWVGDALRPLGYSLNPRKARRRRRGQPMRVTGLTVFEEDGPRVPRQVKRRLRLELYNLCRAIDFGEDQEVEDGDEDGQEVLWAFRRRVSHIKGLVRYCMGVEPETVRSLLEQFPAARDAVQPAAEPIESRAARVAQLVEVISSTKTDALTEQFMQIGQDSPMISG